MLNLSEIDKFRFDFFDCKQNVKYLSSSYESMICQQCTFLTIIQIKNKLQYHTKIYHSVESFDDLIETYKKLWKPHAEKRLSRTLDIRNKLFDLIVKKNHEKKNHKKSNIMKLIKMFDDDETFHLATLIFRFKKNLVDGTIKKQNNFYCFSEIYDVPDYNTCKSHENILDLLIENPSHVRIIFKFSNDDMYFYDSDVCTDFHKIKYFFDFFLVDVNMHHYLKIYKPIQEITDDNYCLFHCLHLLDLINRYNHCYEHDNEDIINSKIVICKFSMKKWISRLHKKILLHDN
jgi:hypothetical protein